MEKFNGVGLINSDHRIEQTRCGVGGGIDILYETVVEDGNLSALAGSDFHS